WFLFYNSCYLRHFLLKNSTFFCAFYLLYFSSSFLFYTKCIIFHPIFLYNSCFQDSAAGAKKYRRYGPLPRRRRYLYLLLFFQIFKGFFHFIHKAFFLLAFAPLALVLVGRSKRISRQLVEPAKSLFRLRAQMLRRLDHQSNIVVASDL